MSNLSQEEKEKILSQIVDTKEEIWETRSYISSDFCKRCEDMYKKIARLEQKLNGLQKKLENDNS